MIDALFTTTGPRRQVAISSLLAAGLLVFSLSGVAIAQQDDEVVDATPDMAVEEGGDAQTTGDATVEGEATNAQVEELSAQLEEREAQLRQAQRELTALRARLPEEEGGNLDLDSAVNSARLTAEAIRAARSELLRAGGSDAALEENIDQLIAELARDQALVARGRGDTLYEVRRGESLAGIAGRYYGNSNRWEAIHEANAHVLRNPDLVWPGLTLVLPR